MKPHFAAPGKAQVRTRHAWECMPHGGLWTLIKVNLPGRNRLEGRMRYKSGRVEPQIWKERNLRSLLSAVSICQLVEVHICQLLERIVSQLLKVHIRQLLESKGTCPCVPGWIPRRTCPLRGRQLSFVGLMLSDKIYSLTNFGKSTPPQNRQLNVSISNRKQCFDDVVGGVTFKTNQWIHSVRWI